MASVPLPTSAPTNDRLNRAQRRHADKVSRLGRRWISVIETAEFLGVSERTVRTMIADGRLKAYRNGKRFVRLDANEIEASMIPFGGAVK